MLPKIKDDLKSDFEYQSLPSLTYKLDVNKNAIQGNCDGLVAIKQAIYKILNTERYECLIYSWNYGVEFKSLYGKPISYVIPELKRRIQDALLQDDRIDSVDDFKFESSDEKVITNFVVHTSYGDINHEMEVKI